MRYWVYGRDGATGKTAEPLFLKADSEATARVLATELGMVVEKIEAMGARHLPARPSAYPEGDCATRLIDCVVCGRQFSSEAEACPQCGHPNRVRTRVPRLSGCSRCGSPAVGACTRCGRFYCPQHGGKRRFWDGSGQGCCEKCIRQWARNYGFGLVFTVIGVLIILLLAGVLSR
jgi:hypothetical protein